MDDDCLWAWSFMDTLSSEIMPIHVAQATYDTRLEDIGFRPS